MRQGWVLDVQNRFWTGHCPKPGLNPSKRGFGRPKLSKTVQNLNLGWVHGLFWEVMEY